ncbi:hypothetical protein Y032_0229g2902 [Ancylostoma ceylanicum]|uniref:Uncharacterized protein n=1 Tax=Ancylostoma ceylanicum TaxID=53326 RepID=A0A016SG05_9BILA|nr:hypothetical protein Y032_0229g2902 [Ancylostoma ceylanicum]
MFTHESLTVETNDERDWLTCRVSKAKGSRTCKLAGSSSYAWLCVISSPGSLSDISPLEVHGSRFCPVLSCLGLTIRGIQS